RAEQNAHGKLVGAAAKDDRPALIEQGKALAAGVKDAQARSTEAEAAFDAAVSKLGNIVHPDVPAGEEANFVTLATHGEERSFDFEPRDHVELGESLKAFDIARGAKVSGSRFYYLTGIGMRLELAIMLMG